MEGSLETSVQSGHYVDIFQSDSLIDSRLSNLSAEFGQITIRSLSSVKISSIWAGNLLVTRYSSTVSSFSHSSIRVVVVKLCDGEKDEWIDGRICKRYPRIHVEEECALNLNPWQECMNTVDKVRWQDT